MSRRTSRILVIDDERSIGITCSRILQAEGHRVDAVLTGREGVERGRTGDYEVVLLDLRMPDLPGMEVLEALIQERPDLHVVIITGYATIQTSIEAIKKGAFDYLPKPFTPDELCLAVNRALDDLALRSENAWLRDEISQLQKPPSIIGRSRVMEAVLLQVRKVAATSFSVMIQGESGTGKELVARAIHDASSRAAGPFLAVDLSALTPSLVESELFGHVRGAFTGATQARPGHFTMAHGGTLFLDEVANMAPDLQGKLLRVLETRRVRPVGSEREHEVDVRVVSATNADLARMVDKGTFREDLFYRLNVIPLRLPPLRERAEDIPLLAARFLQQAAEAAPARVRGFTTEAMARLMAWRWPGNVRELKNLVERLVATVDAELVGAEHLPSEIAGPRFRSVDLGLEGPPRTMEELKLAKREIRELVCGKVEQEFVLDALDRAGWNVTRAAELVGMQRPNFHALMRRHGIRIREEV